MAAGPKTADVGEPTECLRREEAASTPLPSCGDMSSWEEGGNPLAEFSVINRVLLGVEEWRIGLGGGSEETERRRKAAGRSIGERSRSGAGRSESGFFLFIYLLGGGTDCADGSKEVPDEMEFFRPMTPRGCSRDRFRPANKG